jgi:hypothetical protein
MASSPDRYVDRHERGREIITGEFRAYPPSMPPTLLAIAEEVIEECLRAPPLLTLMRSPLRRGLPKWRRWFGVDIKRK